jgi:indolepyruvate ferredoxin oxidoreductase
MSGVQALVRLPMLQRQRDAGRRAEHRGFISGYRGSPLGAYDQALWAAKKHLAQNHIVFQPGVNEELAATAVWGTQQLELYPQSKKYDGVFGIWYGKGPGVDRCSDVFKHANMAGTSRHGGVIAMAGDDHVSKSSTAAHQSDHIFKACGLPVFFPEQRAGHPGHGPARHRDEPLLGRVERHEDDPGGRRIQRQRQRGPRPREDHRAAGL